MTSEISIEQHIDELRAEYGATSCERERRHIFDELRLCERIRISLEWKADAPALQHL